MPYYKTVGIVLRRTNFGEADRILTLLTPEGKLRVVAKGVRRIKSRLAGHLELFGEVSIMCAKGRNLDIITSARLIGSAESLNRDYSGLAKAFLFAEMIDRLVDESMPHQELYDQFKTVLGRLIEDGANAQLELLFKLQLLATLGYRPQLDGCTICHSRSADQAYYLSAQVGGIVDAGCRPVDSNAMSLSQIKLWRLILTQPLSKIQQLTGAMEAAVASLPLCDDFYDYTFGKRFHSSQFLSAA